MHGLRISASSEVISVAIVLASASPRRSELLKQIGLSFTVKASNVEEKVDAHLPPEVVAQQLARLKAHDIAQQCPDDTVIGADTIVVLDKLILGKPKDKDDAKEMLRQLSGSRHQVITGIAVINLTKGIEKCVSEITEVSFKHLSDAEIEAYVATDEPMDKAGAYGIQGRAAVFVPRIEGCYFNVVGLPLARLGQVLTEVGI